MKQDKKPKDRKVFIKMKKINLKDGGSWGAMEIVGGKKKFKLNLNPYLLPKAQVTSI
jgi:hypothetical protein